MRVWLEASSILNPRYPYKAGVTQYTKRLIEALLALDTINDYSLVGNLFITNQPTPIKGPYRLRLVRFLPGKLWNRLIKLGWLPRLDRLLGQRPDLVIFFNFLRLPLSSGISSLTLVHDVGFVKAPQYFTRQTHVYLSRVAESLKRSTGVITISESTKHDLVELYGLDPQRITVVPPAVDSNTFRPTPPTAAQRTRYGLPPRYILFCGTLEPRKNVQGLVAAYQTLPVALRRRYDLVLAGSRGWLDDEIQAAITAFEGPGRIIQTGFVEDADQPAVYSGATLFVYPSFYEGFGMPVVEAMACGVPVITANNSSLPEAAGGAAELVAASDTRQLAKTMRYVLEHPAKQAQLRRDGLKRAKLLGWEASARRLKALIDTIGTHHV